MRSGPRVRVSMPGGFALPATLLAMIVIGAIVTGGVYISSQEHRVSVSSDLGSQALLVAEYGLEEKLAEWRNADLDGLASGVTTSFGPFGVSNGSSQIGRYTARVLPLGQRTYVVEVAGEAVRGSRTARRRVSRFVRTTHAQLPYTTALTVLGQFSAGGNSLVSGYDQCTVDEVSGVMAREDSLVTGIHKNEHEDRIVGDPAVAEDPTMDQDKLSDFGGVSLSELMASATLRLPADANPTNMAPSTSVNADGQTVCDTGDTNNWGSPVDDTHPCADYYPVIHVDGNLKLTTGLGQGILLVDGDLEIAGNLEFSGVVIVTGAFRMTGTGQGTGKINGSVIAQGDGVVETDNTTSGNAQVHYNSCEVRNAFNAGLRVRPFPTRDWAIDASPLP